MSKFFSRKSKRNIIVYVLVPVISVYIASILTYVVSYDHNAPQIECEGTSYSLPLFIVNVDEAGSGNIRIHLDTTDPYIYHIQWYKASHGEVQSIRSSWMSLIRNGRKASIKIPVGEKIQEEVYATLTSSKGYVYRLCVYNTAIPMAQEPDLNKQIDCYKSNNTYLFSIISDERGNYTIEQKACVNRMPFEPGT